MITVVAIGKKHDAWVADGITRYSKRLQGSWKLEWALMPHSSAEGPVARQDESQRILAKLSPTDYVVLLDERGNMLDSPTLARQLQQQIDASKRLVLVIGGAYGVSDELMARADLVWSLSPLVFPHQLVRLLLVEQVYRAQSIATSHPYHHE